MFMKILTKLLFTLALTVVGLEGAKAANPGVLIKEVDFSSGKPLILASSWEINLANDKGALFFEVTPPSSETLIINRSYVGYKGALNLLEKIYSASVGGK